MNCLSVERLAKRYGPRQLFKDVSFGLERGQKTAIVARNGTGKSTLLKCIAGIETPDEGNITFNKGLRIGYLDQSVTMTGTHTLVDEMLDQDEPVTNAIRAYEHAVARHTDDRTMQQAVDRMTELNAWDHEARVKSLLFRFGLRDMEQPVNTLSGGQQKRLAMAKVLINKPDVLILDDWGMTAMDAPTRSDLMEIIDDRAGTRATIVTSQLPIEHWHAWIGDATIADAILDRLLSRSQRLQLKGKSLRPPKAGSSAAVTAADTPASAGAGTDQP